MKKYPFPLLLLTILTCCNYPESRSWIIPVTIDPADNFYTPEQMECFEIRRSVVLDSMDEGFLVIKSTDEESYNRHQFRPNNYFFYLTGCSAPNTYLILGKGVPYPFTLGLPPENIRMVIYEGAVMTADQADTLYHPDRVISFREVPTLLDSIIGSGATVYTDPGNSDLLDELRSMAGEGAESTFRSVSELVDEMRVIKDPLESERLQKACNITALALTRVMRECKPGRYEFEMESVIEGTFIAYGSPMPGFPSIVGSGANSTILHYEKNNCIMEDGDLLLMDIGAEYGQYTADISRTIPVNGKFTPEQQTIYQLVLDAQLAAIEKMKPGNGFIDGPAEARRIIAEGLARLGLITDLESPWQVQIYLPHGTSHFLGLDVHDVGETGVNYMQFMQQSPRDSVESRMLEPGMVLTIEPGIYFRQKGLDQVFEIFGNVADSAEIAAFVEQVSPLYENYINIGVRIEDDILITREGNINLSRYAPKQIEDIEQIMR
jgi:Xaa-Pro aminopeptidase